MEPPPWGDFQSGPPTPSPTRRRHGKGEEGPKALSRSVDSSGVNSNLVVLELDRTPRSAGGSATPAAPSLGGAPAEAGAPEAAVQPGGAAPEADALRGALEQALAMVREAVATIAGEHASLDESLAGSAARVEQIAQSNDIRQIQARLVDEVVRLKRLAQERRATWEDTVGAFRTRLTRLEQQLDHTRREAALDPLTNVANRRTFERACQEWLQPNRAGFVVAMADVDDFKAINDRFGHAVGDRLLVTVAETLSRAVRGDDLVARVGGDEFAVLAACLTLPQAARRFAAIAGAVRTACAAVVPDRRQPSISIGLAECSAGDTLESLQERADAALYHAKRNGKGGVAIKASPATRTPAAGGARR